MDQQELESLIKLIGRYDNVNIPVYVESKIYTGREIDSYISLYGNLVNNQFANQDVFQPATKSGLYNNAANSGYFEYVLANSNVELPLFTSLSGRDMLQFNTTFLNKDIGQQAAFLVYLAVETKSSLKIIYTGYEHTCNNAKQTVAHYNSLLIENGQLIPSSINIEQFGITDKLKIGEYVRANANLKTQIKQAGGLEKGFGAVAYFLISDLKNDKIGIHEFKVLATQTDLVLRTYGITPSQEWELVMKLI